MDSPSVPSRVRYWRREARVSPHRDWHTFYRGANWTGVRDG